MTYLPAARPATDRLSREWSFTAAVTTLFRRIPRPVRRTAEEHLAAEARREAARAAVDRLLR
jgi:hypothetical protein